MHATVIAERVGHSEPVWRYGIYADREYAGGGDSGCFQGGDEAGLGWPGVPAPVNAAVVAVLRSPGGERGRCGAVHFGAQSASWGYSDSAAVTV